MKTNHSLLIATCLTAGLLPSTTSAQLREDFQKDAVGSSPLGAYFITADADVTVVDNGSPNLDPFAGADNQSMLLNATPSGSEQPTWVVFKSHDDFYEKGTFSMDIYGVNRNSYTYFRLGNTSIWSGIPNEHTAVNLLIRWGNVLSSWDADGNAFDFDITLQPDTVYSIVIQFDSPSKSWSATVNGEALTADNGATTTFDFFQKNNNTVEHIDRAHWYAIPESGGTMTLIDNISLSE